MEDRLGVLVDFLLEIAAHQRAARNLLWQSGYSNPLYDQALTEAKAELDALPAVQTFRSQGDSGRIEPLLAAMKTSLAAPFGG